MAQQPDTFRDFGILPRGIQPPPENIRSFLSRGRIIGQYIATGLVSAVGLGVAVLLALTMPLPLNVLGCAAALVSFGALAYLATHNDYRWVELDGRTLRAQHLYTGHVIERSLEEIECLATMVYQVRTTETVVIEKWLGRVKGVEIRFRDHRTPLRILRSDPAMTNARELIEALIYRMAQIREVDVDIVSWAGAPLVRLIYWKGETPPAPSAKKSVKVALCCVMILALFAGLILGFCGLQERRLQVLGSVPAQAIPLQTLIEHGPGDNPHVTVTNFRFGGYAVETTNGSWSMVRIALYPTGQADRTPVEGAQESKEIKAVLEVHRIGNKAALQRFLQHPRVTGICSDTPRSSWGTMGTTLTQANPGSRLTSAWLIEELSEPPSAALVRANFLGSGACYGLAIVFALILFRMS